MQEPYPAEFQALLAIFDQHNHLISDEHILEINEKDYPPQYQSLIRRLQQAIAEPDVRRNMNAEDEILEDLQNMERVIERSRQELAEKERILQENQRALAEKDKLIAQLQQRLQQMH